MNPRYRRLLIPGLLVALVVIVLAAALIDGARADSAGATTACTVNDQRIDEASGMAASMRQDGLVHVINDSGSVPEVYTLDSSSCEVVGVTAVDGVAWHDPEALALDGDGMLWIADTGDNAGVRDDAALYALPEPTPGFDRATPTVHPVAYETGKEDVEALLVHPVDGRMWLITKGLLGGELLELPEELPTDEVSLARSTGRSMPILVTDATMAPDGRHALVRTYVRATLYDVEDDFEQVWSRLLPLQQQGETITIEPGATSYLVGSEGVGQPLQRIPLEFAAPGGSAAEDGPGAAVPQPQSVHASETNDTSTLGRLLASPLTWATAAAIAVVLASIVVKSARRPT